VEVSQKRIVLVDASLESSEVLVRRLHAQGYLVEATTDPALGADMALAAPPAAVIADLWMPSISGVQLCRLLRAEAATRDVPVILRGEVDDPKSRFWAERAGAAAYVRKGHMGELVRVLAKAAVVQPAADGFFMQLSGGNVDIRDRIARHLDAALFDSVIAAEVRALAACGSVDRLFDLFSQLVSQLVNYRWLALSTVSPACFGLHYHPHSAAVAEAEARAALGADLSNNLIRVADEDASEEQTGPKAIVFEIPFAGRILGRLAIAPLAGGEEDATNMLKLVSSELGGPLRMAALVDEQERLAAIDPLTNLANRRSFLAQMTTEISRSGRYGLPLVILMMDIDHFKLINDTHGHAGGDHVLTDLAAQLRHELRTSDLASRWGGEEFIVALTNTDLEGGRMAAERIRAAVAKLVVLHDGKPVPVTASLGIASFDGKESLDTLIDRADRAMYSAKVSGRNLVVAAGDLDCPRDNKQSKLAS